MFNAEESLNLLLEMRRKVVMMKGEAVEGLPPLENEDENKKPAVLLNKKQQEMNA